MAFMDAAIGFVKAKRGVKVNATTGFA